ncbi:MAG: ParM/StbA family protein [Clostridiales bacterium]|jgi:plasmid segregation protein ParM|nr:ParM/StbA family protein [Clostridiales bacterium]
MIQPKNFCVPTILSDHNCFTLPNIKLVAIDIGYSGVKCYTDKLHACFPSLARPVDATALIGEPNPDDILYRDENGSTWLVGASALREISLQDTNDSERTLYSRQRYGSEMFKVIFRVGLGLCLMGEKEIAGGGGRPIFLQTGLPPAYIQSDRQDLVEALSGIHLFSVRFGYKQWKEFCVEINPDHIDVMPQPVGSLFSASINDDGKKVPEAKDYFKTSILGFDPGFGTADTFVISNGTIKAYDSFDNLGMKAVYKCLSDQIYKTYGVYIPTHAIQKVLIDGYVQKLDKKNMTTSDIPIVEMLEQCNRWACEQAIEKIKVTYDYLREFKYLLVAGGTGEAWIEYINQHFSGMSKLKIILGNQLNPDLPLIFSNVRGYYVKQAGVLRGKI